MVSLRAHRPSLPTTIVQHASFNGKSLRAANRWSRTQHLALLRSIGVESSGAEIVSFDQLDELVGRKRLAITIIITEVDQATDDTVWNRLNHALQEAPQLG